MSQLPGQFPPISLKISYPSTAYHLESSADMYRPEGPPSVESSVCCTSSMSMSEKDRLEVDNLQIQHDHVLASCPCRAPSVLTWAIIQGKSCFVQYMMGRFPVCVNLPDWNNQRPIMVAMEYRQHEILQSLLCDPHTNVNVADKSGHTLLHLAVIYDDVTAVEILLKHKKCQAVCGSRPGLTG